MDARQNHKNCVHIRSCVLTIKKRVEMEVFVNLAGIELIIVIIWNFAGPWLLITLIIANAISFFLGKRSGGIEKGHRLAEGSEGTSAQMLGSPRTTIRQFEKWLEMVVCVTLAIGFEQTVVIIWNIADPWLPITLIIANAISFVLGEGLDKRRAAFMENETSGCKAIAKMAQHPRRTKN